MAWSLDDRAFSPDSGTSRSRTADRLSPTAQRATGRPGDKVATKPQAGDVLHITREASVQFVHPMMFRVIRIHDWSTYDGWMWIDGYQLDSSGDAVERRSIFVQRDGLRMAGRFADRAAGSHERSAAKVGISR